MKIKTKLVESAIAVTCTLFCSIAGTAQAQTPTSDQPVVTTKNETTDPAHPTSLAEARDRAIKTLVAAAEADNRGNRLYKSGNFAMAEEAFQQELAIVPGSPQALYSLAKCAEAEDDKQGEIGWLRKIIYAQGPAQGDDGTVKFRPCDIGPTMELAILLSENGLADESLTVYRHGVAHFNDANPPRPVKLPDFTEHRYTYSSNRLEAMANVILNIEYYDYKNPTVYLDRALVLAPNSAVAHYYHSKEIHDADKQRAELEQALKYDDGTDADAIKYRLKFVQPISRN